MVRQALLAQDALIAAERHRAEAAEKDVAHAIREAKKYSPSYPWQLNTASEAVWALGQGALGIDAACGDWRKKAEAAEKRVAELEAERRCTWFVLGYESDDGRSLDTLASEVIAQKDNRIADLEAETCDRELEVENARLWKQAEALEGEILKLYAFKQLVHSRLDAMGAPACNGQPCPDCKGQRGGMVDSGGVEPWGSPIDVWADCEFCSGTGACRISARLAWVEEKLREFYRMKCIN